MNSSALGVLCFAESPAIDVSIVTGMTSQSRQDPLPVPYEFLVRPAIKNQYEVHEKTIIVLIVSIAHRKDAYR
jgi:hypothetical protein